MESFAVGFMIGVGIPFGIVFCLAILILLFKQAKKAASKSFDEDKLAKAFVRYSKRLQDDERYGEIPEVKYIIQQLEDGLIPNEVKTFVIKKKNDIALKEGSDENHIIRMVERYIVVGKKNPSK
jgi:hypothetical protein